MNKIFKYEITSSEMVLSLPEGFEVFTVQNQNGKLQLWVKVDFDNPLVDVTILELGTGYGCPDNFKYISTAQFNNLAFHYFIKG